MKTRSRVAGVLAASTLLVLSATSARADIVTNDLQIKYDGDIEQMTLQYDDVADPGIAGPAGSTTFSIIIEGLEAGDHPGCDIQGEAHNLLLVPTYDATVVSVSLSNGGYFDTCADTVVATVTPVAVGATMVTFANSVPDVNGDWHTTFDYTDAAFHVTVERATLTDGGGGGSLCDAEPAAPAWAAALLAGNGKQKAKKGLEANYVSQVAAVMSQRASWPDGQGGWIPKAENGAYADAVWHYMTGSLGLTLPNGPDAVARPGWRCTLLGQ